MLNAIMSLDLIRLFDFYLACMFILGTVRRFRLYRETVGVAAAFPSRWPNLLKLMHNHHALFLTWRTFLPSILTLVVWMAHLAASRWIWHQAVLSVRDVASHWPALILVGVLGAAMMTVDIFFLIVVGSFDRAKLEGYFDQAEHWLSSWKAPVVRAVTLGFINPRKLVNEEVRKALVAAGNLLERSLYLTALQMGLRVAYGLSLWLSWAIWGGSTAAPESPTLATTSQLLSLCWV